VAGAAGLAAGAAAHAGSSAPSRTVHVSAFGARGDGTTNDTDAIHAASQRIQEMGGGTLIFEPKIYIIGKQERRGTTSREGGPDGGGWAFEPSPVVDIRGCRSKVTILGNGAVLRCAPGLRYGTFDRATGRPTHNPMPFTDVRQLASPYRAAIWLQENSGGVEVSGFEIDGQIQRAVIGGPWGDTGWQINHCGLWIYNNRGAHLIRDIHSHHHGQDGLLLFAEIPSETTPPVPMRVENLRCDHNGRQGISLTGGKGVVIRNCKLNHTGRNGAVASNPGAGLDLEAELSLIRDVIVSDCLFDDNYGQGIVADTGDTEGVTFERCKFVGATNYAAWPNKPRFRFLDCEFVGSVTRCFEDPAGTPRATQFIGCRFFDDPSRSSTGRVYGSRIDLGGSGGGTLFDSCLFRYTHHMQLPYTPSTVRYHDCDMSQVSPEEAYPSGIYTGTTVIRGNVRLGAASYRGRLTINGEAIPQN
jgi:hypothetical protein